MGTVARERFEAALERLVDDVRLDDHILAVILCGSLSHDEVWDKSDIDLILVSTDDKKSPTHSVALVQDDINIHTTVQPRNDFRRRLEASNRNSFIHSTLAKARLVYSRDPSIDTLFAELSVVGERDAQIQAMHSAVHAIACLYKAYKWFEIKRDVAYTAWWITQTARAMGEVVVGLAGEVVGREAMVDAVALEPELMQAAYVDLFEKKVTRAALGRGIKALEDYLEPRAPTLFALVLEYLEQAQGEPRSTTELNHHFERNYGITEVVTACEWLADIGLIEKASTPVKLTTRSQLEVDELAFFRVGEGW